MAVVRVEVVVGSLVGRGRVELKQTKRGQAPPTEAVAVAEEVAVGLWVFRLGHH